jgi:hypothetical protein
MCRTIDETLAQWAAEDDSVELIAEFVITPAGNGLFAQLSCDGRIVDYFTADELADDEFNGTGFADQPIEPSAWEMVR